ncbi:MULTISPECIES: hypothetical protein [unclassified Microbacterium]|uniref:hypothetical protein n=1 Tax=Microbacterium sp. CIAB417 TaxID=2860287 RepID=UPI001FACC56A|nr:hypothetical protein [Microbacterium sp. CIAB417]
MTGPLLVVDDHGWVATQQGVSVRDRVEAPQPDHAIAVPGLGVCLPERLRGGCLISPRGEDAPLTALLDLRGAQAQLVVSSADSTWRTSLSRRHADILAALADAGPAGTSAERLSRALYGDAEHQVTVRAEIPRMRRTLGALVAGNSYRVSEGVALTVVRTE